MTPRMVEILRTCNLNDGANPGALDLLNEAFYGRLPCELLNLLSYTNGLEGPVGAKNYLVLYGTETLISVNEAYSVSEFRPGGILFGSDGGGEGYFFDGRFDSMPIIQMPFIGVGFEEAWPMGNTIEEFLELVFSYDQDCG